MAARGNSSNFQGSHDQKSFKGHKPTFVIKKTQWSKRLNVGESSLPAKEKLCISLFTSSMVRGVHTWPTQLLKADFHQVSFLLKRLFLLRAVFVILKFSSTTWTRFFTVKKTTTKKTTITFNVENSTSLKGDGEEERLKKWTVSRRFLCLDLWISGTVTGLWDCVRSWSRLWSDQLKVFTVAVVGLVGVWQPVLLAPPGSVTSSSCLGTGCCQKAYGGHSGHVSLSSLSERLGMGRVGNRMAFPLRNTHTKLKGHMAARGDTVHRI